MRTIAHPAHTPGRALIVYCAGIFSLVALPNDLYLPALPAIRSALDATDAQTQLTLSAFAVGFGLAQLGYGPLSDRFGRRPVLLAGLALFMLGSIAAVSAPSIEWLVAARLLQGIGGCSGPVIGRAIVRDVFDPLRGARALAQIMALVGLVPMCAPLVGGYLTVWFGWRANFAFMLLYGLGLWVATWTVLAESNRHPEPGAASFRQLARNARAIFAHPAFAAYAACFTLTYTGLFVYLSAAPFVLIDVLGVRPQDFGLWFVIPIIGNFFGSIACARLTRRMPLPRVLGIGSVFTAAGGALMLALAATGIAHPLAVVAPMAAFLFGLAMINPVCLAAAVAPFPQLAGTASALLGCVQFVIAALAGQVFMRAFFDGAPVQLAFAVALAGVLSAAVYLLLIRPLERG